MIYRGTREQLHDQAPQARQWFIDQIMQISEGTAADYLKSDRWHQEIERATGAHQMYAEGTHRYVWRFGSRSAEWLDPQRVVMRRDGTLNPDLILDALRCVQERDDHQARKDTIGTENAALWASHKHPGKGHPYARIALSTEALGMATVTYEADVRIGPTDVKIEMLSFWIMLCDDTNREFTTNKQARGL